VSAITYRSTHVLKEWPASAFNSLVQNVQEFKFGILFLINLSYTACVRACVCVRVCVCVCVCELKSMIIRLKNRSLTSTQWMIRRHSSSRLARLSSSLFVINSNTFLSLQQEHKTVIQLWPHMVLWTRETRNLKHKHKRCVMVWGGMHKSGIS
jgi:hypothetical protein